MQRLIHALLDSDLVGLRVLLKVCLVRTQKGISCVGAAEISVEEAQQATGLDAAHDGAMPDPGVIRRKLVQEVRFRRDLGPS
jgi:hypothetical protein